MVGEKPSSLVASCGKGNQLLRPAFVCVLREDHLASAAGATTTLLRIFEVALDQLLKLLASFVGRNGTTEPLVDLRNPVGDHKRPARQRIVDAVRHKTVSRHVSGVIAQHDRRRGVHPANVIELQGLAR